MPLGRPLRRLALCAVATTATLVACQNVGTDPPVQPTLEAVLRSPNGAEGAAVIDLSGPGLLGPVETPRVTFVNVEGTGTRLVVLLDEPGEITFTIAVADVAEFPTATVVEVADGNNELRTSLAGYTVEFTPR